MKGKIIITANPEKAAAAAAERGLSLDDTTALNIDMRITEVNGKNKLALVKGLAGALKFSMMDWILLFSLVMGVGPISELSESVEIPRTTGMIQKIEEAENE